MKLSKRLFTVLLVFVMLVSTFAIIASAEEVDENKIPETHFAFSKASEWWFKTELWDAETSFWGEGTKTTVTYDDAGGFLVSTRVDINYGYDYYKQFNMMHQDIPASEDVAYIDITNNTDKAVHVKLAVGGYTTPADADLPVLAANSTQRFELGVLTGSDMQVMVAAYEGNFALGSEQFQVSAVYTLVDAPDQPVIYGDANDDDDVNAKDSLIIRQYNANYEVDINLVAADVNVDGDVTAKDSLLIRKYVANYPVELGVAQ